LAFVPGELFSPVQLRWQAVTATSQKNLVLQTQAVALRLPSVFASLLQLSKHNVPFQVYPELQKQELVPFVDPFELATPAQEKVWTHWDPLQTNPEMQLQAVRFKFPAVYDMAWQLIWHCKSVVFQL
jgi:hypothetical protein